MRNFTKKNRRNLFRGISLLVLIAGLLVALGLIRSPMFRGLFAASYTAQFSFQPSNVQLRTSINVPIDVYLDPAGAQVGFARVLINFDPSLVQLSSEVELSASPLTQQIKKTSLAEANSSGVIELVLGLKPENRSNPMIAKSKIATLNLTTKSTANNLSTSLDFLKPEMQIVDMSEVATQIGSTPANLLINPSATPIPTPVATPTPVPTRTPSPAPTVTPTVNPTVAPTPVPTKAPSPTPSPSPVATATPIPTPTPSTGNGLTGTYYNNKNFTGEVLNRVDSKIDFYWGFGSPDSRIVSDTYSIRWTGKIKTAAAGTYTFSTRSDDGVRLWVNNTQLINDWRDHGLKERSGTISLPANTMVDIRLEYYENNGVSEVYLLWTQPGGNKVIIPTTNLYR